MPTLTTAEYLNQLIQAHIDGRLAGAYVWHSGVYLHPPDAAGCNWNIEINCNDEIDHCGAIIAEYLDALRREYVIPDDEATADPAFDSRANRSTDAGSSE